MYMYMQISVHNIMCIICVYFWTFYKFTSPPSILSLLSLSIFPSPSPLLSLFELS